MKLKLLVYTGITLALFATACNDNDKKTPEPPVVKVVPEDTTATETISDSIFDEEMVDTFNTTAFSTYAKRNSNSFDWSRFRMTSNWIDDSLVTASFTPDKKFYEEYGKFIKYSPDSSMFIDLDSYNIDIEKDSKGRLTGIELGPDCEVSLINLKTKQKKRLMFLGPGGSVEDGLWLDNDNLVLMGVQDHGDSTGKVAAVWKVHVPTNTFYLYELQDGGAAQKIMGFWRKERLKSVGPR